MVRNRQCKWTRLLADDRVGRVLLGALGLGSKQGGDSPTGEDTTDLTGARSAQLFNDGRVLLAKAARVEEDGFAVALEPALTTEGLDGEGDENEEGGLGEHFGCGIRDDGYVELVVFELPGTLNLEQAKTKEGRACGTPGLPGGRVVEEQK